MTSPEQQQPAVSNHPEITTQTTAPLTGQTEFTTALKEWVEVDNKITQYSQKLKEYRQQKNHLTPSICNYMERENMRDLNIQISDGSLHYANEHTTPSFSQKFLLEGLTAYFTSKSSEEHAPEYAKECLEFLKQRRVPETKSVLKRKYTTTKQ